MFELNLNVGDLLVFVLVQMVNIRQNTVESVQDGCDKRIAFRVASQGFRIFLLFPLCGCDQTGAAFHAQKRAGTFRDDGESHVQEGFFARNEDGFPHGIKGVECDLQARAVEGNHLRGEHGLCERFLAERFPDVEDQFFPDDRSRNLLGFGVAVFSDRYGFRTAARARSLDPDDVFLLRGTFDDWFGDDLDLRLRRGLLNSLDLRFGNDFDLRLRRGLLNRFLFLLDLRFGRGFLYRVGLRFGRGFLFYLNLRLRRRLLNRFRLLFRLNLRLRFGRGLLNRSRCYADFGSPY